jgi:hypothetical protein
MAVWLKMLHEGNLILRRLVGYLLIIASTAGIIFSMIGLRDVWHYRSAVQ